DAFFAAFTLIAFFLLFFSAGTIQGALMPAYQSRIEEGDRPGSVYILRETTLVVLVIACIVALLVWIFAPHMVNGVFAGFGAKTRQHAIVFTRLLIPIVVLGSLGAIFQSVLHSRREFLSPAIIPILNNAVILTSVLVASSSLGVTALAIGFCLGYLPWLLLLGPLVAPDYRGYAERRPRSMSTISISFLFLSGIIIIDQFSNVFQRSLLSRFEPGIISTFTYGTKIAGLPIGIIVGALASVIFPRFVSAINSGNTEEIGHALRRGLVAVLTLLFPISAFLYLEATLVIATLFGRDNLGSAGFTNTITVLKIYALLIPAQALILLYTRALIAATRNRYLLLNIICAGLFHIGITWALVRWLGWIGVPIGTFVYAYFHSALFLMTSGLLAKPDFIDMSASLVRLCTAIVLSLTGTLLVGGDDYLWTAVRVGIMGILYFGSLALMRESELRDLILERVR
ncbi:MAG: hypothetical protein J0H25_18640, partial [Rhizobiales bacterium]|nr:hypothetical protein [Hyphomicrobiales bacterium]